MLIRIELIGFLRKFLGHRDKLSGNARVICLVGNSNAPFCIETKVGGV